MNSPASRSSLAALATAALLLGACAPSRLTLHGAVGMPYPPAELKADDIQHVPTGTRLTPDQLTDMIAGARVVYVGEMHNNLRAHAVQLEIIKALERRFPGAVAIGMEMFREGQQPVLDRWTKGELTELDFLKESKWYENWGSDFGYYRDILGFAREKGLDVIALKPSEEQEALVRKTDWAELSEADRARLPQIGAEDPYQRATIDAIFAGHKPTEGMLRTFRRIQTLWEETMAQRAVEYLTGPRGQDKHLVVIAGTGHLEFGFGIPKKALRRLALPYTIILPEAIAIPEDKKEELTMDVDAPELPLYRADFVWWVPYEDLEGKGMRIGVVMNTREGKLLVEQVQEGSPGEKAGALAGDEILSFDGQAIKTAMDLRLLVGARKEGDRSTLVVRRGGVETALEVTFFPMPVKPAKEK
jgi:uncharacterized iron-regulated protein